MLTNQLPTRLLDNILALILGVTLSAHPVSAAAPLRVSANGHYLERPNGKPFFFLSDTEWLLNVHSDTQVRAILDDRKRKGFTVIQVFGCRGWSREDLQSNLPFQDNSPLRFNQPYWDRWRWIADQAKQRGLLLLFIYGEPGRADTPWKVHGRAEVYAYGHLVGQTFHDKTNIIFCDGQDIDATLGIGVDGWRAMAKGVADGVNGKNDPQGPTDYQTTTMTFHGYRISQNFHADAWLDFYGPEVWHDTGAVYDQIHDDYNLPAPIKPTILLEGSYEDETSDHGPSPITAHYMRTEAWRTFFSGGAGYAYGHFDNWRQTDSISYLDSVGAHQMAILASFLTARHWWLFVPDQGIVSEGEGSGQARITAIRSASGDECCVYFPDRVTAQIRMDRITKSKTAQAVWLDPRTGKSQTAGIFKTSDIVSVTPPEGWEDAVLSLARSRTAR